MPTRKSENSSDKPKSHDSAPHMGQKSTGKKAEEMSKSRLENREKEHHTEAGKSPRSDRNEKETNYEERNQFGIQNPGQQQQPTHHDKNFNTQPRSSQKTKPENRHEKKTPDERLGYTSNEPWSEGKDFDESSEERQEREKE